MLNINNNNKKNIIKDISRKESLCNCPTKNGKPIESSVVNNEQQQKNIETKESRVISQKIDFITFYLSQPFLTKPVKQYYNNNKKKRIKTLKEYYTKESRWLLTFLLSQKIDFITFFLSKTLIKKFVKP